ncbi:TetR/AcrR family transcriptional regulator [Nocardia terpenica]|nr:TetR/AcrR family transcriptional regulator [Nocardia terpenica]
MVGRGPDRVEFDPDHVARLWRHRDRPTRGPRPELSAEAIVRAAIEIADAEGLGAVSMARVAERVGSGTMSLYRHVSGKPELIAAMLDRAIGPPPRSVPGHWRVRLRHWVDDTIEVFRRHPWALSLATERRMRGPHEIAWFETALSAIDGIGLSEREMAEVVLSVNAYALGAARSAVDADAAERLTGVTEDRWIPAFADFLQRMADDARFPVLSRVVVSGAITDPVGYEFGLDRLLDGVEGFVVRRNSE